MPLVQIAIPVTLIGPRSGDKQFLCQRTGDARDANSGVVGEPKVECDLLFTNRPVCVAGQTHQASRIPAMRQAPK
jgi:hypothetical protein